MSYEPLHHKYRPQTFADLVGQSAIATTLSFAIKQSKIAPAYLFTGPRGTGKTSSARILAKSLNCLSSDRPTPTPCGKCEVCQAIARGSALDVMEIDAASNTGVDNIREIIERSQFAPVQSRYKVYAIDECLTGDSLVQTNTGLMRIDDPKLKGKLILSYNENTKAWEYKKVLRWLERGTKETLAIKTSNHLIRCTKNHLIRTDKGWIKAENVKEGMKILSPVNADAVKVSTNMAQMAEFADLLQDISLEVTNMEASHITSPKFLGKQRQYNLGVNVDVTKNLIFPTFFKKKEKALKVSNLTGKGIHTEKVTESGIIGDKISLTPLNNYNTNNLDSSTEHCWEMEASNIQTHTVDFLDYVGHMGNNSKNGWITKQVAYNNCVHKYRPSLIEDTAKNQLFVTQLVILSCKKFIKLLNQKIKENQFRWNGLDLLHQKDLHGGTWMTALFNLVQKEVPPYFFTLKGFLHQKIKLLLTGLRIWDILPIQNLTQENLRKKLTTTLSSEQNLVENGYQIYKNTQFPQWNTNLEKVEFVHHDGYEKVYDLEVEDNHNFVANGLLVHNCHMLSTAAFNALLKTLEEPPDRVVFVLATTDPQRVLSTIISRCQRFDFRRIPLADMVSHLKYIATEEKIRITDETITLVAQIANGGLRDAESLLDQLSLLPELITVEQVWDLVGSVPEQDLLILLRAIAANQPEKVIEQCRNLLDRGREPLVVLQNLASFYLNLLIAKTAPNRPDLVAVTETTWQNLCTQAQSWDTQEILRGQQHLKEAEVQIKNTTQPRLWLEVTLLGLLSLSSSVDKEAHRKQPQINQETIPSKTEASNQVFSVPTTKVELPEANSITTPQPNNVSTSPSQKLTPIPTNSPPPLVENRITSNSEVLAPDLSKVANPKSEIQTSVPAKQSSTPTKPPAQNSLTPDISPQEVWKKAIDYLQPPTTQALFRQKCHLISLEGSVAVVGISSPQLLKLNQGKIPNLEAAFAKACEQAIKVQLEVSTAELKSEIPVSPEVQPPATQTPASPPIPTKSRELSTNTPEKKTLTQDIAIAQPEIKTNFPPQIGLNQEKEKTKIKEEKQATVISSTENLAEIPQQVELDSVKLPTDNIEQNPNYSSDVMDEQLQKAIETLAKNFEGEVVTIASVIDNEAEETNTEESEPDNLSKPKDDHNASECQSEPLSAQKLATNHTSFNPNQSSPTPQPILHNRPDLSEYEDDEDIPFIRLIYSKTNIGKELCDSWELEANHYWEGFKN